MENRILEGLKILLVEEEVLIAMDLEQLCYDLGAFSVSTISSETELTPEALDSDEGQARIREATAAILDAKVGTDWTSELARRLSRLGTPFIFATGYTRNDSFFDEFPDIPVIAKPYAGMELAEVIAAAVAQARSGHGG
ncbi:response regulator [Chelativorans sp. AA-79]|uniref:response regulator n=1 Tax=Chelativorans sp. AA-79 TaxID=3028735 RepID=UPI0023F6207A|nr:response regulator [Chelativorans sp. AA-79]WEX10040.1 response regulator [Chelativorans sp. AA-79]